MSLPELRCLLCDRVLLDENTALPSERCLQCGKLMQLGLPPHPSVPPGEQAGTTPGEGSLLTTAFDELPEAIPVVQPRSAPPILRAAAPAPERPIPVVLPRSEPPVVRPAATAAPATKPKWEPPIQMHPPVPPHEDEIERPKPRYGCALLVMLAFAFLALMAVTFVLYAIARGLKKLPKTEATPTKVVDSTPSKPDKPKVPGPEVAATNPAVSKWIPPTGTYPVATPNAGATATVPLPARSSYGVLAGSGRFILFPLPESQLIALFDTGTAKLAGFLPMPDPESLVAASSNEVYILAPGARRLQRYSLHTLDAERTVNLDDRVGEPRAMVAGHSARGPIYLLSAKKAGTELHLIDIETLEPIAWTPEVAPFQKPNGVFTGGASGERAYLRASADGRMLLGGVAKGNQNYRVDRFELFGANPRIAPTGISVDRPAFPTADGGMSAFAINPKSTRFPMAEGNGYFEISEKGGGRVLSLTFVGEGHVQRAELKDIPDFAPDSGPNQDRRAFLIPGAKAFVHLGADGRTIHWKRIKISEELPKSTQDYLVVAGTPALTATRGQRYDYTPIVLSNVSETSIKLETAPAGMMLEGRMIVWQVPADFPLTDVAVELTLESKLKPEVAAKQRYTISVLPKPPDGMKWFAPVLKHPATTRQVRAGKPDDPLAFVSEPKKTVKRLERYRTMLKLSTPEDAEVTILAAPAGAEWDGDELVWKVPPDDNLIAVPIVILATTKSGRQIVLGYLLDFRE